MRLVCLVAFCLLFSALYFVLDLHKGWLWYEQFCPLLIASSPHFLTWVVIVEQTSKSYWIMCLIWKPYIISPCSHHPVMGGVVWFLRHCVCYYLPDPQILVIFGIAIVVTRTHSWISLMDGWIWSWDWFCGAWDVEIFFFFSISSSHLQVHQLLFS